MHKDTQFHPFKEARVIDGSTIYVEFYAWNAETQELERRRIYRINGQNRREKLSDAQRQAKEINQLLREGFVFGRQTNPLERPKTVLRAFREAADIKCQDAGHATRTNIRGIEARFSEWITTSRLEKMKLEDLSRKHICAFLDEIKRVRNLSNTTYNNYRDQLKTVLQIMVEREWLKANPAAGIKRLKSRPHKYRIFTREQQRTTENYLQQHNWPLFAFTRMIYYGFLRPVEITRLKVEHVFLDRGIIMVYSEISKNNKQQPVVITQQLGPVLAEYLAKYAGGLPGSAYLFSRHFKPGLTYTHRNRFSDAHREVLKRLDLHDGSLNGYSWKHTGVTNAYLAGVDIVSIQKQCRHYSLAETEKYLRALGLRIPTELKTAKW